MEKVIVGISGGVDSAVAALLLKNAGYEVEGLFMRNWDSTINNDILGNPNSIMDICPQEQDYNDALELCKELGIKLHRIDFVKEYWDYVFTYFLEELKKGRTPNPDLLCNKYIKFDLFIKEAQKLGADYIATGHYARIKDGKLLRAVDLNKDQTYFLADVPAKNFRNVLFPIGDYTKPEIRKIAEENNLNAIRSSNGGLAGIDAVFYKRGFFTAWTVNAGANSAEASTRLGNQDFVMFNTGIAEKTGYNFELLDRKLILQPSFLMSYSFINTFNYTTDYNVSINADPIHAIHIEPQIKIIGNFKNYLQPYISVSMVWNILDSSRFQANDVYIPSLSVKPFVEYGVGVQKRWGERLTGFVEGMIRNGGRNGIALQLGFRISL